MPPPRLPELDSLQPLEMLVAAPDGNLEDPFAKLLAALEGTAAALGADSRCVTWLRGLFGVAPWDADGLAEQSVDALLAGHVLDNGDGVLARSSVFTDQALAWRAILRGESEDFALTTSLDEWAADVLARLIGSPARSDTIRRELRRRGIAAFGIVAEAA